MRTRSPSVPAPLHRAFTLVELMVVIVIIGILAGITVPATVKMIAMGKAKAALSDATQLKNAINSYTTEYRKLPKRDLDPDDGNNPDFSGHALMDILLPSEKEGSPGGMTPRNKGFCSYNTARPMGGGKYRSGIVMSDDGGGELFDPYGNPYRVVMDTDFDNKIPAPSFDSGAKYINQTVIVWSAGPDGDDSTVEDNIMTWRP